MTRGLASALLLCWLIVPCANAVRDAVPVRADIQIRIDPETRELIGKGTWTIPPGESPAISLDERFDMRRLEVDGRPLSAVTQRDGRRQWRLARSDGAARRVEIEWRGLLEPLEPGLDHREVLRHALPVTAPRGTFLPAAAQWHPVFIGLPLQYTLSVNIPQVAARHRRRGSCVGQQHGWPTPADLPVRAARPGDRPDGRAVPRHGTEIHRRRQP
jgi:hypothetical protein